MSEIYLRKQRKALMACLYLLSAFYGFHSILTPSPQPIDLFLSLCIGIIATLFCLVDAKIQRKFLPKLAGWLILVLWPIAVPLCLFWSHGRQGSLRVLLFLVSIVVVCFGGGIVAAIIEPSHRYFRG